MRHKQWCVLGFIMVLLGTPPSMAMPPSIQLEKVHVNHDDWQAVVRGAKVYKQHCMACHAMKHMAHDMKRKALGLSIKDMPVHGSEWHLDAAIPPDLSLVAKFKGVDWVYTYLHSFYEDKHRDLGVNNLLAPNVNMPNVLAGLQGRQVLLAKHRFDTTYGSLPHYYNVLKHAQNGSMTPTQYDRLVLDLVSFFDYAAEPHAKIRMMLGYWMLGFLVVFLVVVWLLKRNYWRDIR
jgi:ubiquinol-cytochrome c reductase cytochrome c1 subunit